MAIQNQHSTSKRIQSIKWLIPVFLLQISCGGETEPQITPPGEDESAKTEVLEGGSAALQTDAPLDPFNVYLVGFHPMKDNPGQQVEAHHICDQVNEDFAQCVLFDSNTEDANLTGIEYIISENLYDSLPEQEKQYWHPHNYEILSGQLVGPGLPELAEKELMESKMNSYGKTWHTWSSKTADEKGDRIPLGRAMLAWSFNRDGELKPNLLKERNKRMSIDPEEKRKEREELIPLANPQFGVDLLKGKFPGESFSIKGVVDKNAASDSKD